MKYLTMSYRKDSFFSLPAEERKELGIATMEHMVALMRTMGDKYTFYSAPRWGRGISIGEYASLEDYSGSLQTPTFQFNHFESYPLIESSLKEWEAYLAQMKA